MAIDGSVSLTGSGYFPSVSASGLTGEWWNGAADLGDADNTGAEATPLTLGATTLAENVFSGAAAWLPYAIADASLEPPLSLPLFDVAAQLVAGAAASGTVHLVWQADAFLLAGGLATGDARLDAPDAAGDTGPGADLVLAPPAVNGVLLSGTLADGGAVLVQAQLAGTALADGAGAGAATLLSPQLAASGSARPYTTGAVLLAAPAVEALALAGTRASATAVLAAWSVAAAALADNSAAGAVLLAAPSVDGALALRAATLYRMLVLNPRTRAVTEYDGPAANSLAWFNGEVLAATADGIMALRGDTDAGAPIAASMTSGRLDFGSDHAKRLSAGYCGYRADGALTLSLAADNGAASRYPLAPRGAGLHPNRTLFGRGARGRYWQWTLANSDGAAFAVDALAFDADVLARRV